jgi:F0F1-type ATP synthase assembly protein I
LCAPGSVTERESSNPAQDDPGGVKPLPSAAAFLGMGLSSAVCVAAGVVLGIWADSAWHSSPALLVVGLLAGLGLATFFVVGQVRKYL